MRRRFARRTASARSDSLTAAAVKSRLTLASLIAFSLTIGGSACTFIVDSNGDQCSNSADCAAKGPAFAGLVCTERRVCERVPCTSNDECIARNGGEPSICRQVDRVCAKLFSEDCKAFLGDPTDLHDDNTVWFGTLLPIIGDDASTGIPNQNGIELARRDFKVAANGLPPLSAAGKRRPIAFVSCNDAADAERAARHLVNDVKVPAIIGPAFSGITIKVATNVTIPGGVLIISGSATSPYITKLDDKGLVWRTAPPDTVQSVAIGLLLSSKVEPDLRDTTTGVLKGSDQLRLAVANKGDAYGTGLAGALGEKLQFNGGKSATANGSNYLQSDYGDPGDPANTKPDEKYAATVKAILAFKPHVIIIAGTGEGVTKIFDPIEKGWAASGASYKPRWILADGGQVPELWNLVGSNNELRKRILGTVPGTTSPLYDAFALRYKSTFTDGTAPDQYTAAFYDATYVLVYATAFNGTKPLTGQNLNESLKHLVPPGVAIDVGQAGISAAFTTLGQGKNIDYTGASGPLDFDTATGEAESDIQIWCVDDGGTGKAIGFKNSTAFYNATTHKLQGTVSCP